MPLNIRWLQKDYFCIALMLFGACSMFQALIIFITQFHLGIGNIFILIIVPIGVTVALFYCTIIIFESFAQVQRRRKIKSQFQKLKGYSKIQKFLEFPIIRPILIIFTIFITIFLIFYITIQFYLSSIFAFIIAQNIAIFICLLVANLIEKVYGVQRF